MINLEKKPYFRSILVPFGPKTIKQDFLQKNNTLTSFEKTPDKQTIGRGVFYRTFTAWVEEEKKNSTKKVIIRLVRT